jgi:ankyrin repeat protein
MVSRIITQAKKKGLDIDAFGAGGWSPLGLAVRVGNTPIVDALLAAGARGNVGRGNCKSPIDIARVNNRVAILEAIEKSQVNEA